MPLKLHDLSPDCKLPDEMSPQVLQEIYAPSLVEAALAPRIDQLEQEKRLRKRKLPLLVVLWMVIIMNWFPQRSQPTVLAIMAAAPSIHWPTDHLPLPGPSALPKRRKQLGVEPLQQLFRQACKPLASFQTKGAYRLGYRVMAIDGTWQDVPDTAANAQAFGRFQTGKSQSAFPQARVVILVECGTHAIVDADIDSCCRSEHHGAHLVLRSLTPDMLVTLDAGFQSVGLWFGIRQTGAHVLGMLKSGTMKSRGKVLSDGSVLTQMAPSSTAVYPCSEAVPVRVISYQITDPKAGRIDRIFRLATTLLDPVAAPARELIALYHERWEVELVIDELKTHQLLSKRTLRSETPEGVHQELYGWLLAHYALRAWMHQAAIGIDVDPDRLSFTLALAAVEKSLYYYALFDEQERPQVIRRMLADMRRFVLPPRRFRLNARVVRQPRSKWKRKWPKDFLGSHFKDRSFLDVVRLVS